MCVCCDLGGSLQAKLEEATRQSELQASVQIIQNNLQKLKQFVRRMDSQGEAGWQLAARDFAYTLAWIYEGSELPQNLLLPYHKIISDC